VSEEWGGGYHQVWDKLVVYLVCGVYLFAIFFQTVGAGHVAQTAGGVLLEGEVPQPQTRR
jgi:hypothetical protein